MKQGLIIGMDPAKLEEEFIKLKNLGFEACQLAGWDRRTFTDENAGTIKRLIEKHSVEVSAFWCGWEAPCEWNLTHGPTTIGLVPAAYRFERLRTLKAGSDFCKKIGITDIITHVGFIPVSPADPDYIGLVGALRELAGHCRKNGQYFLFETGQETPVTLLRTIEDIGLDNVGINLDPANLLMYGMANPIDSLDVFGKYVRNVHGKDGEYPTNGRELGVEKPLGQGRVNYPAFIRKLKEIGYDRYIIIEREITGEEQIRDIVAAKAILDQLLSSEGDRR